MVTSTGLALVSSILEWKVGYALNYESWFSQSFDLQFLFHKNEIFD